MAGYHTEYSGMKFAMFMLSEYASMLVNSALLVSLFFGGWTLGMFGIGLTTDALLAMGWIGGALGAAIFLGKVMFFMVVYVWFRATFPRFRFDQLMDLGWKWMIPVALVNIFVTGIFVLLGQEWLLTWIGIVLLVMTALYLFRKPAADPRKVIHAS